MIRVSDLAEHPDFVPPLVDAFFHEWPEWCSRVGRGAVEAIFEPGPDGALPLVLVAHDEGDVAGTIALRAWFGDEAMAETPWVRQLLVLPRFRGRNVDRLLGAAVEQRARGLGFTALYAGTDRIERLLLRRGWEACRRVEHEGKPMAWLRKGLTSG